MYVPHWVGIAQAKKIVLFVTCYMVTQDVTSCSLFLATRLAAKLRSLKGKWKGMTWLVGRVVARQYCVEGMYGGG
jgi:hypothetical protein